ncbi:MAG: MFS transporter [Thaumarchaeota archaeon]|nr:MFS transporter [Nitrososphaerota archaeon]
MIIPIIPPFTRGMGASEALIGVAVGVFGLGRLFFDLPTGAMAQRYPARRIMFFSLALVIVASLLASSAKELSVLFVARFIEGASVSLFLISGLTIIAGLTKTGRRGKLMSITTGMVEMGNLLGPAIGGLVAEAYGLVYTFYLYVLLAVFCIPFVFFSFREPSLTGGQVRLDLKALRRLILNRDLLKVNLATFALFLARFGILYTGIPLIAYDNLGLSEGAVGGMLATASLTSFPLLYAAGYLSDRFGRKPFMITALLSLSLVVAFVARAPDAGTMTVLLLLFGVSSGLVGPTAAWFIDLAPPEVRGGAMGMYRFFNDVAVTLGPIMVGGLIGVTRGDRIEPLPFDVVVVVLLVMAVVVSRARDPASEARRSNKS